MKIPFSQFSVAYDASKLYYDGRLTRQGAIERIIESGMNQGSAIIYFQVFQLLRQGEPFTRTLNTASFDYFLLRILEDSGPLELSKALTALRQHIEYLENKKNYQMGKVRMVYEKYAQVFLDLTSSEELPSEEEVAFPEGAELYRTHRYKERNSKLIVEAKKLYQKKNPDMPCQVCELSFIQAYGEIGEGFIEAHHIYPISELTKETPTKISDLVFLCSNCHRMIHRRRPWLSKEDLSNQYSLTKKK